MKAAVLRAIGEPLELCEVVVPEPGPGQVLLRVHACGLCHTDLRIIAGEIPTVAPPRVLGHEIAGEVVACGPGAERVRVGQAAVCRMDLVCGVCRACRSGRTNLCARLQRLGFEADGGHTQYLAVPADNLVPIASTLSYPEAAVLGCAVASMYHAMVRQIGVRIGDRAVVLGVGGVGMQGVQLLKLMGARVLVTSRQDERLDFARSQGADAAVNTGRQDLLRAVLDFSDGEGVDCVFDTTGLSTSIQQSLELVRPGGKVAVVGYQDPTFVVKYEPLVIKEKEIVGCRSSTIQDVVELVRLAGEGRIKPVVTRQFPLAQVNEGLAQLSAGSIIGRAVLLPQG